MITIKDLKTDNSGDIIFNGDIRIEEDSFISSIKIAERRFVARIGDFIYDPIGAGFEEFLNKYSTDMLRIAIKERAYKVLEKNHLFTKDDFSIELYEIPETKKLGLYFIVENMFVGGEYKFHIKLNQFNQRSYNNGSTY